MTKIITYFLLVTVLLVTLSGCRTAQENDVATDRGSEKSSYREWESNDDTVFSFDLAEVFGFRKPYKGDVELAEYDELPSLELNRESNDMLHFQGNYYVLLHSEEEFDFSSVSGWRIHLNDLSAEGKTPSGDILLASDKNEPMVVCISSQDADNLQCYLRKDLYETGVGGLGFDSFDVFYDGCLVEQREGVERIWNYHINGCDEIALGPVLDGYDTWTFYSLTLVHRSCSALQYEFNFGVNSETVFMEFLPYNNIGMMPLELITVTAG